MTKPQNPLCMELCKRRDLEEFTAKQPNKSIDADEATMWCLLSTSMVLIADMECSYNVKWVGPMCSLYAGVTAVDVFMFYRKTSRERDSKNRSSDGRQLIFAYEFPT